MREARRDGRLPLEVVGGGGRSVGVGVGVGIGVRLYGREGRGAHAVAQHGGVQPVEGHELLPRPIPVGHLETVSTYEWVAHFSNLLPTVRTGGVHTFQISNIHKKKIFPFVIFFFSSFRSNQNTHERKTTTG